MVSHLNAPTIFKPNSEDSGQAIPLYEEEVQNLRTQGTDQVNEEYKFFTYACHKMCKTCILSKI